MDTLFAFIFGLALGLTLGAASMSIPQRRRGLAGLRRVVAPPLSTSPSPSAEQQRLAELRRNLLLKVGGDAATVESLLAFEETRQPKAPLVRLYEYAIDRWEIENRSRN